MLVQKLLTKIQEARLIYSIKAKLADEIRGYSELLKNNILIYSREIKISSDFWENNKERFPLLY